MSADPAAVMAMSTLPRSVTEPSGMANILSGNGCQTSTVTNQKVTANRSLRQSFTQLLTSVKRTFLSGSPAAFLSSSSMTTSKSTFSFSRMSSNREGYDKLSVAREDETSSTAEPMLARSGAAESVGCAVAPDPGNHAVTSSSSSCKLTPCHEFNKYTQCEPIDEDDYSDDASSYEDSYSCAVCERAFYTARELKKHRLKKNHWGCGACEERFSSMVLLDMHKAQWDHWSDDEVPYDSQDEDPDSIRDCMNDLADIQDELADKNERQVEREMLLL